MSSIDRGDTIEILKDLQKDHLQFCLIPFRQAIERVQALPSTDRPQGEWIEVDDALISCRCSACGWEAHLYEDDVYGMPYCPNCGCRMKGADDE